MSRYPAIGLVTLFLASTLTGAVLTAEARRDEQGGQPGQRQSAPAPQQNRGGGGQQARAAQEGSRQQQQQSRQAQEQSVRAQEDQARQAQQAQQMQQRQQQEQARQSQQAGQMRDMQRQQQTSRNRDEQSGRAPREQQQLQPQESAQQQQSRGRGRPEVAATNTRDQQDLGVERPGNSEFGRSQASSAMNNSGGSRGSQPRPLKAPSAALEKAISMPALQANVTADERDHNQNVVQNLRNHLIPMAANQAPANFGSIRSSGLNRYTDNYATDINNQRVVLNRLNTCVLPVPQYEYPAWWNPQNANGWQFSNGFTLGSTIRVGLDWLRWGWHPYYGPPPDGFVCATDYVPTQWMYVPAYGLWRQAGIMGWSSGPPPYDYTGPITVEILEPRHIHVRDPYTGFENTTIVNVPYLYNAFYDPSEERWGYMTRSNYFVWLNV